MDINGKLFSGDAILQSKPYVNNRNGSKDLFLKSAKKILETYKPDEEIYPGHGEPFPLRDYVLIDFLCNADNSGN